MLSVLQKPLVMKEKKSKDIDGNEAMEQINKFLTSEVGAQSAPTGMIQQLRQLQKTLAKINRGPNSSSASDTDEQLKGAGSEMFGSGGAFGSSGGTGGFGSQAKPTNTFGGFGQSSNSGTTAFGSTSGTGTNTGFGSAGTGAFGRSSGSGGFGSTTGTFGSGSSTVGSTTGGFGSTTGGFGSGSTGGTSSGNVFGQAAQPSTTSSLFGGGSGGFGTTAAATGTARVNYEPTIEMTANGKRDHFTNICFMNAYKDFSPEELRLQDYEAGRKKADAMPGAGGFGQTSSTGGTSAFGQSSGSATTPFGQTPAVSGATGSTGLFSSSGGFGQTSGAGTTGFGQTSTAGSLGFGQTPSTTGSGFGGAFASGSGIGGFGQTAGGATGTGMGNAAADKPAFGQASAGGFGSGGGFGSTSTAAPTSGFGASTGFGSSTGTGGFGSSTGGFGQQTSGTSGFNSSSGFGAKPAFSAFGTPATSQPAASTGGFGQTSTGGGGFGTNTGSSAFGGGGGTTGMFGTNTGNAGGGTGAFGTNTGTTAAGGGGFFNKPADTGGSIFGNTGGGTTGTGMFGNTGAAGGNAAGAGGFGTTGAVSGAGTGGSLFGNTGANAGGGGGSSLFGASKPAGTTGSMFNSTSGTGGGLGFGTSGAGTSGSLFGTQNTGGLGTGGTGMFNTGGNAATSGVGAGTGGSLFSSAGGGGSMFGPKPAAPTGVGTGGGSLFASGGTGTGFGLGAASNQTPSLFGAQGQQQQQQQQQPLSLFGQAGQQQQQQPAQLPALQTGQLAAQIDRQPYGVSALFDTSKLANKATAARTGQSHLTATPLRASVGSQALGDKDAEHKKRGLNLKQLSTPHAGTAMSSRLRSRRFAAPANDTTGMRLQAAGVGMTPKAAATAPRTPAGKGREVSGLFGRDGFLSPESQLPHSNVKRLVITRKPSFGINATQHKEEADKAKGADESPLRDRASTIAELETSRLSPSPPPMDNPWADTPRAARVHATLTHPKGSAEKPRRASAAAAADSRLAEDAEAYDAPVVADGPEYASDEEATEEEEDEDGAGKYWMRPPLEDLRAMTTQQLHAVRNFTVGRNGVGQVSFGRPVDLTTVGSLGAIAGGVVLFSDRVCTVYPDESNKPARGQGLNVPATISLHNCWPVDRATGEPIEHMDDPRVRKHIRRLRRIEETEFVDFVAGTWIFRVKHFSRYGLDDNHEDGFDDEDTVDAGTESQQQQGFGKATASSASRTLSRLGGSDVVAQQQQQQPSPSADAAARRHVSFDAGLLDSSGSDTDILASTSHSDEDLAGPTHSDAGADADDQADAPTPRLPFPQRPPPQLLLGTRHADALRRAPVMRASLFSTGSSAGSAGNKRPAAEPTASATVATRPAFFGRVQSRSPAVAQPLHAKANAQPAAAKTATRGNGRRASGRRTTGQSSRATTATAATAVSVAALDLPPPSKYLRTSETGIARELLAAPQPYATSLTHGHSGVSADAGLMMARSFRVAFGPQGQLVYLRGAGRASSGPDAAAERFGRGASSVVVVDNIARHLHAAPGAIDVVAACTGAEGDREVPADRVSEGSAAALDHHRQLHLRAVRAQWEHTIVRATPSAGAICPQVSFRDDTSIASVLASLRRAGGGSDSVDVPTDESRVLELAAVLFDTLSDDAGDSGDLTDAQRARIASVRRRQALTRWLTAAVAEHVQHDLLQAGQSAAPAAAAVFALLSGHRIEAACLAATSHRDYRLATLVAQCGAGAVGGGGNDQQVHVLVRAQLDRIAATAGQGLSPAYRRVYELISGNAQWMTHSRTAKQSSSSSGDSAVAADEDYVAAGVDWKRAFGLGLWYAQSPADPVADAVVLYEREVERRAPVAPPLPSWLFACPAAAKQNLAAASVVQLQRMCGPVASAGPLIAQRAVDLQNRGVWDPAFQLLKLYGAPSFPLEAALLPESFSPARGDVRLPALLAWLLATVRACRGFDDACRYPDSAAVVSMSYNRLLTGWALQLEALGQWHWACFVLLQLASSPHKEHAIRALLERSLPNALPTSTLTPSLGADLLPPALGAEGGASVDQAEEQVRFVLHELQLPRAWLYDAYATRARYERDLSDVWAAQSHRLMRRELAADTVGHFVHADEMARRTTASGRQIVPSYFSRFTGLHGQAAPLSSSALSGSTLSSASSQLSSSFRKQQQPQQPDACAIATLRQVTWLLSAGRFASAHAVVLQRIAPDAILRGDHRLLARIFALVDPRQHSDGDSRPVVLVPLDEWATGGQVFLAFVAAIDELPEVLERIAAFEEDSANGDMEDMETLTQRVRAIYHQMTSLLAALPALLARFELNMPISSNGGPTTSAAALASVVDSERARSSSASATAALGFYDSDEANWFSGEESCELRVKYLVAVSDMASIVTGLIRELEQCVPGLAASSSASMDVSGGAGLQKNTELSPGHVALSSLDSMDDDTLVVDSALLPLAQDMRILRTHQLARSCFDSLVTDELEV
ncbi:hypothetical protein H4R20_001657 [Coemansia guatemalensis]|uniref:Peptidase S59 domain-containing protein n=1 Tax=Coemansia guatemalensis TaxID=2761395 RepID=A0A9W8I2Y0_9FUNG|nr:hypothetical protein H4R20_001657 [Coemansia guatemalensis]